MISRCTGLLPLATKLGQGYIFTGICDSVHRGGVRGCGGHVWLPGGMCGLQGGMCGCRGHAWLPGGSMFAGGMCGCQGACIVAGGMHGYWGVCVVTGGHAWLLGACMVAREGACIGYDEIRSMSGRYASCCNAFLFLKLRDALIPKSTTVNTSHCYPCNYLKERKQEQVIFNL